MTDCNDLDAIVWDRRNKFQSTAGQLTAATMLYWGDCTTTTMFQSTADPLTDCNRQP